MTIKEAVEKYNHIKNEITDIKNTISPILQNPIIDPLSTYYKINSEYMTTIVTYLNNYIKILEQRLEEEFK